MHIIGYETIILAYAQQLSLFLGGKWNLCRNSIINLNGFYFIYTIFTLYRKTLSITKALSSLFQIKCQFCISYHWMCINVNDTPIKFYEIANNENIKYNEIDVLLLGLIKWFLAHLDNDVFSSKIALHQNLMSLSFAL